jgi:Cu-processing system permease protein
MMNKAVVSAVLRRPSSVARIRVLASRELREALRNRWLWLYAAGFALLALALSSAGLAASGYAGLGGFGRTAASLINAVLLFAPLIGLTVGAGTFAGDRERGTLLYLLAQPVSRAEVFAGKALGAALAVVAALALGFGLAGLGLSVGGGDAVGYAALAGYTLLLALASLGIGFIISTLSRKAAAASGVALLVWLALTFLADLGVLGAALSLRPTPATLFALLVLNPLQVFKLAAIYSLQAALDVLGPVGQYATHTFGAGLPVMLIGLMLSWVGITIGIAYAIFNRKGDA